MSVRFTDEAVVTLARRECRDLFAEVSDLVARVDLGSVCCLRGAFCCPRCARNLAFRGGSVATSLMEDEDLLSRVATGLKPVGLVILGSALSDARKPLRIPPDAIELVRRRTKWGLWVSVVACASQSRLLLRDLVDPDAVARVAPWLAPGFPADARVHDLAVRHTFTDEELDFVVLGALYGYPLWSSVALERRSKKRKNAQLDKVLVGCVGGWLCE